MSGLEKTSIRKFIFLFSISIAGLNSCNSQGKPFYSSVHIIPEPVSVKVKQGYFQLNNSTIIICTNQQIKDIANMMSVLLNTPTGYHLTVKNSDNEDQINAIVLKLNKTSNAEIGKAGYVLKVSQYQVLIVANKPRGLFYGMQTLMQLLPPDIESKTVVSSGKWQIPCLYILDYPRFSWRGLMLDVSRHFFSKEFIEQYINEMARYKLNVFHWHLTDDQGWRIQIKGLPKLTEVGAWRVARTGHFHGFNPPQPGERATDGGYYTQEDIRDIVAYARRRFITIVPEIDVPGHSMALIASYPNLSCTQKQYPVDPGNTRTGDNVLSVADDSTWLILNKIFTQVAALFPGKYINIGGDEVRTVFWANDPKDRALMKREGITSLEGLQGYFEKRLEKMINSKGKRVIGWYPLHQGELTPKAVFICWKNISSGIQMINMGYHVVMAPNGYCYLDYSQGDQLIEPFANGMLRVSTCYKFEPVPQGVNSKNILGTEDCLWTENVPNERHVEYMTWPRAMALSEVSWSLKSKRNWDAFASRMQYRFKYMDVAQVKYARSIYDPIITRVRDANDSLEVKLTTEIPGLDIYYRFDGTNPDSFSPKYEGKPLDIPKGATQIRVITYRYGKAIGHQINCPISEVAKR